MKTTLQGARSSSLLVLSVAPRAQEEGAEVTAYMCTTASVDVMTFPFPFDMPDASVVPIDGSMAGGATRRRTGTGRAP